MSKLFIILFFLLISTGLRAQSKEQLYAGVILHVMKYVEWPNYGESLTVGVVNDAQLVNALQKASRGKQIHYKNVSIQKMQDLNVIGSTDVLYFSKRAHKDLLPAIIRTAESKGILVITEGKSDDLSGVAINFLENQGHLELELYESVMLRTGIKASDQLKKIAVIK